MNDKIDAAIAAASAPEPVALVNVEVGIASTGRPVVLSVPVDMTGNELLELVSWMTNPGGLAFNLSQLRGQGGLIVPRRITQQ